MAVMGKGNIRIIVDGRNHIISEVFYIPELQNNLLSIGQLQEKGLAVLIQDNVCKLFHKVHGLIMQTDMSTNRMFILFANMPASTPTRCLQATSDSLTSLWHKRFGHLHMKGLRTLVYRKMVNGLPLLKASSKLCSECVEGKQSRDRFQQSSAWRATQPLQLIHSDICGPITPASNGQKRMVEKEISSPICCLRTDRDGEFTSSTFNDFCANHGIRRQLTAVYSPQQNDVAERRNRTLMNMIRYVLQQQSKIKHHRRPGVDLSHQSDTLRWVSQESKAYRMFDPNSKKIVISRDVVFDEEEQWDWEQKRTMNTILKSDDDEEHAEPVPNEEVQGHNEDEQHNNESPGGSNNNDSGGSSSSSSSSSRPSTNEFSDASPVQGRIRRQPTYMKDFAVKYAKWREAMNLEIEAIKRNETWELVDLPKSAKTIRVKWVFKTKLNEMGEVDKYKARLVAKGYSQQADIDYTEVFAPVARWDTIRMILALAASRNWLVYQLDVKSAFLHGEIEEKVYVEQPQGYVIPGAEHKVYRLKKVLYGLKQAPRAWFSKIDAYFSVQGFERCSSEPTLFVKTGKNAEVLIVSLYVDDFIFTGNNVEMCEAFKMSM
ncbi:retrovirus-related pol polyprotein from transposon TNT 1-94 [Tanacetum coccineum]